MRRPGPHRLCKVSSEASARAVHVAGATAGDLGQGERGAGGEALAGVRDDLCAQDVSVPAAAAERQQEVGEAVGPAAAAATSVEDGLGRQQ